MKTLKYIALAALTISLAACTQDDDFIPQGDADAVKINATIGKLQTRVAYENDGTTNFINGDEICVQNILRESKNIATYTLMEAFGPLPMLSYGMAVQQRANSRHGILLRHRSTSSPCPHFRMIMKD